MALVTEEPLEPVRVLDGLDRLLAVGLLILIAAVAYEVARLPSRVSESAAVSFPGVIEAEELRAVGSSENLRLFRQPMAEFRSGTWSKEVQVFASADAPGSWVEFELPAEARGPRRLEIFLTRSPEYGVIEVSLNGKRVGEPTDLWARDGVTPTGAIDFGLVSLRDGSDRLRITVTAASPRAPSPAYHFGVDGFRLAVPQP